MIEQPLVITIRTIKPRKRPMQYARPLSNHMKRTREAAPRRQQEAIKYDVFEFSDPAFYHHNSRIGISDQFGMIYRRDPDSTRWQFRNSMRLNIGEPWTKLNNQAVEQELNRIMQTRVASDRRRY